MTTRAVIKRLHDMCVEADATLWDALEAINRGGQGISFVCNSKGRVIGTLTDGDVRRAVLDGAALQARCLRTAMRREFSFVRSRDARADVLDMMRARDINQVPVLDARGRLVALHLLRELLGAVERDNWAVLMAGGQGVRLRPLTRHVPKPMITVAGRPILERLVLHLVGWGIRRIFISVNYLSNVIERHFRDGSAFGCRIEYLREKRPLGTGGSLWLLPSVPKSPIVVMNGDLLTQANLAKLLDVHERGRYVATLGLRPYSIDVPYGVAAVLGDRIVRLEEKPSHRMLVNAGIYVLSPRALRMVPKGQAFPITELFQRCLDRELRVGAHFIETEWVDIGGPEELRKARGAP